MSKWTFITKHAVALSFINTYPRITALELGAAMGLTERMVRKILADLYAAGYFSKKKEGRGIQYGINPDLPMRQDTVRDVAVGDLLGSLGWRILPSEK